jgi:lipoprotein-releasing system permease protein
MWQGSLIALAGILIGVTLGVIGSLQVSDLAAALESALGFRILNAEVYPIDFLPSDLQWMDVLTVVLGVFALSILATLIPARRAAAVQPAQALRAE